ncbi:MAG: SDR family NAD(P)-dependent oxidoreductase [Promethearchaeota archaeon]
MNPKENKKIKSDHKKEQENREKNKKKTKTFMGWEEPGWALITGASAGLGREFAIQLAQKGFNLILVARRLERLEELANTLAPQFNIQIVPLKADLSTEAGINAVRDKIRSQDNLDILINNAGFGARGKFFETDFQKHLNMHFVHIIAPITFMREAIPKMLERNRGLIINVSSLASWAITPQSASYCATKAHLRTFSDALSLDLYNTGVKIQALCPGFTHTEFHSVGDYSGNEVKNIPKILWMDAKKVIKISLKKAEKGKVVVIPGFKNKLIKFLYTAPIFKSIIRKSIRKSMEKDSVFSRNVVATNE